ncbi:MAG: GerMN domain-containing protein [Eubacterium sp.]
MKKTKKCGIYALCTVLVFSILFSGCGKKNAGETETGLFYLNQEKTRIVKEEYEPEAEDTEGLIEEFLSKISEETGSVDYRKVFPDKVKIERYEFEKNQLYLYFNKAYQEMTASEEVLCRGAIVHTMMQIDGVNGVSFYVDNLPLTDARGQTVGIMTNDSFVENPGEKIN